MEMPSWVKRYPVLSAVFTFLFILASFVQPLWKMFTEKPLVPTVASWLGVTAVSDLSLAWLPWAGVPIGLALLYAIWRETQRKTRQVPGVKRQPIPESRLLRMVGDAKQSQITFFGQFDLEVRIAVRFENSASNQRFVRSLNAYIIKEDSKERLATPSITEIAAQPRTFKLENGLAVDPGISGLYYANFSVSPFSKEDQTFELEMEALGQEPQRVEIIPNWLYIIPTHLSPNTVREIRDLN